MVIFTNMVMEIQKMKGRTGLFASWIQHQKKKNICCKDTQKIICMACVREIITIGPFLFTGNSHTKFY